jgi:hypothetical protein
LVGSTEPLEKIDSVFVDGDFAAVNTSKINSPRACLVLFFARTPDGWRNWMLRNGPAELVLKESLSKEVATLDKVFKKRGSEFVDLLSAGKFADASGQLAEVMRNAMAIPEAKLAGIWHDLETANGKYLGHDTPRIERQAEYFCALVPCRWEKAQFDLKVVFDLAGQVSGLWVLPASAPSAATPAQPNAEAEHAALAAAQPWLAQIDAGKYAESWNTASELIKKAVSQKQFESSLEAARTPLGALVSRKLKSSQYATSLPGVPDGQYVVLQFDTAFANKNEAVETVTPMLDKDGTWRVSGYYIK